MYGGLKMESLVEYLNSLFRDEKKYQCSDLLTFKEEGDWILVSRDFMPPKKIHSIEILNWKLLGEQELIDLVLKY